MGHGRRMSTQMYLVAYELCRVRDGEKCAGCGWTYGMKPTAIQRQHPLGENMQRLEMHHIDGHPWNNPPDGTNWSLLCKTCNLWWGVEEMGGGVCPGDDADGFKGKQVGRLEGGCEEDKTMMSERGRSTQIVRGQVEYRAGEATMQANAFYEGPFRLYCLEQVIQRNQVKYKDLRASGAERVGCSPKTADRYLEKLTSLEGLLKIIQDEFGEKWVMLRTNEKPKRKRR